MIHFQTVSLIFVLIFGFCMKQFEMPSTLILFQVNISFEEHKAFVEACDYSIIYHCLFDVGFMIAYCLFLRSLGYLRTKILFAMDFMETFIFAYELMYDVEEILFAPFLGCNIIKYALISEAMSGLIINKMQQMWEKPLKKTKTS